jgi:energy-coupling factor transport system permease protein
MKIKVFSYDQLDTPIHALSGFTKLVCFLLLTFAVMLSYDIRAILCVMAFSFAILFVSRIKLGKIKWMLVYTFVFLLVNFILSYLFAPEQGVKIYGTRHEMFQLFGFYTITEEQLLYQVTKSMKYFSVIPLGIIFLFTTNPSEFASSLSGVGVPYKAAYAASLTLRYLPDVIQEYMDISRAQQARGMDMSRKEKLLKRVKNVLTIIIPLIFSTLDRIDLITNAMNLRGFGKNKKRTWYTRKDFNKKDWAAIFICITIFFAMGALSVFVNKSRFFNPFNA